MRRDDSPLGKPKAVGAQRGARSNGGNKQNAKQQQGRTVKLSFVRPPLLVLLWINAALIYRLTPK